MKMTSTLCLATSLALATTGTAKADRGRHDGNYRQHQRDYRHDHHSNNWRGPAALLAITGLAIGAIACSQANTAPVYVAPPRPIEAPAGSGNWYYCDSAGQYYPYVRHCDEGWQTVMPPRQEWKTGQKAR